MSVKSRMAAFIAYIVLGLGAFAPRTLRQTGRGNLGIGNGPRGPGAGALPMLVTQGQQTWQAQPDDFVSVYTSGSITLPDVGYRLVKVLVEAGSTPGSFQVTYDGVSSAHFPAGSNATSGALAWACLWRFQGTTLKSSLFAFNGGVATATLTFSKGKSMGPSIEAYRAIRFTVTHAATHSTPTALTKTNYDVAPAVPKWAYAFATVTGDTFYWPQIATAQAGGQADSQPSAGSIHMAPAIPKATSLTPLYTNVTAAGTLDLYVGYTPQ